MDIRLLTCGGTIDKKYGSGAGIRDMHIGKPVASDILRRMGPPGIEWHVKSLMRKDSLDMDDSDRATIGKFCRSAPASKIIITHGTDTMIKTAKALNEWGLGAKHCIVLTGALQPARMKVSDAEFNLGLALAAVLLRQAGVWIAMHGIHRWDRCRKDPETGMFIPL